MQALGTFDIIGPIMIGPSSSHTAGALRIALLAREVAPGAIRSVEFVLYGSFAHTYRGHGTDRALAAGILGFDTRDARIPDALGYARDAGVELTFTPDDLTEVEHPNTVDLIITTEDGRCTRVRGVSTGGGAAKIVRIGGVDVEVTGDRPTLFIAQHDVSGVLAFISSCLGEAGINIAVATMYREARGTEAYTIMETDEPIDPSIVARIEEHPAIRRVTLIELPERSARALEADGPEPCPCDFTTADQLQALCEREGWSLGEAMLQREMALGGRGRGELLGQMGECLRVMRGSVRAAFEDTTPSMGGFLGGQASAMEGLRTSGGTYAGPLMAKAVSYALGVLETNARMGLIVAAPTAGSAGVVPGALLAAGEERGYAESDVVMGLFDAAAVGYLIARNASVSGAAGGCQAEVGSASAMAASALVRLAGGDVRSCLASAAMALTNVLGMVCDPVLGLVEEPCQKRDALGVANAIACADMALAGIGCVIGLDDAIAASDQVGRSLPYELRETALGGVAACYRCTGDCR